MDCVFYHPFDGARGPEGFPLRIDWILPILPTIVTTQKRSVSSS
jgi:hypothetical protein